MSQTNGKSENELLSSQDGQCEIDLGSGEVEGVVCMGVTAAECGQEGSVIFAGVALLRPVLPGR